MVPEQTSDDPSPSQVKGYAQIMEGLEEQLKSLSVVASKIRTRASGATPTSQIHMQAPNVTPTHPLVAPGLERPFDAQSKPASSPGRAQDARRDLLVSSPMTYLGQMTNARVECFTPGNE